MDTVDSLKSWLTTHVPIPTLQDVRTWLSARSPWATHPVDAVLWVPIEQVSPNDYNPNAVAKVEMGLLYTSIKHDGFTQPIVTVFDEATGQYVIVDGFHRYYIAKTSPDILASTNGCLPVVVIHKGMNDRMASTVRHNRARGKHSIQGMASLVFSMLDGGWSDAGICNELAMSPEELVRLKHVTGFSRLFEKAEYQRAWVTRSQVRAALAYRQETSPDAPTTDRRPT